MDWSKILAGANKLQASNPSDDTGASTDAFISSCRELPILTARQFLPAQAVLREHRNSSSRSGPASLGNPHLFCACLTSGCARRTTSNQRPLLAEVFPDQYLAQLQAQYHHYFFGPFPMTGIGRVCRGRRSCLYRRLNRFRIVRLRRIICGGDCCWMLSRDARKISVRSDEQLHFDRLAGTKECCSYND